MNIISPSIMCIDLLKLGEQIKILDQAGADMYHVDIMDGHFVPNHALSSDTVRAIKRSTDTSVDVHLMVTNPADFIDMYAKAGADYITIHLESTIHPIRAMKRIRAHGIKSGIAINPATDITPLKYMLEFVDMVCVMSVDPGFAGQTLISSTYQKIAEVRKMLDQSGYNINIMVDGQVKKETAPHMIEAGANVLVVGSSGLFAYPQSEYSQIINSYKNL